MPVFGIEDYYRKGKIIYIKMCILDAEIFYFMALQLRLLDKTSYMYLL